MSHIDHFVARSCARISESEQRTGTGNGQAKTRFQPDYPSRTALARAMTDCTLLRIEKKAMLRALTKEVELANVFWAYVLARNLRYQQDLVDQHCHSSEKRLPRVLLLLAHFDGHGAIETTVPNMKHETLAEMVGTTRSRICFFMKRFKESGFIFYEHHGKLLRVHRTLFAFCRE